MEQEEAEQANLALIAGTGVCGVHAQITGNKLWQESVGVVWTDIHKVNIE